MSECLSPVKLAELRHLAQEAMKPENKVKEFRSLIADAREPYANRKYKQRIGSVPHRLLHEALGLSTSKHGGVISSEVSAVLHREVNQILENTETSLANGSPRTIMDELFEQTKLRIPFLASLIGQAGKPASDEPKEITAS